MARNDARDKEPKQIDLEKVAQLIDALSGISRKSRAGPATFQLLRTS